MLAGNVALFLQTQKVLPRLFPMPRLETTLSKMSQRTPSRLTACELSNQQQFALQTALTFDS
jgi:hypothetical protein